MSKLLWETKYYDVYDTHIEFKSNSGCEHNNPLIIPYSCTILKDGDKIKVGDKQYCSAEDAWLSVSDCIGKQYTSDASVTGYSPIIRYRR